MGAGNESPSALICFEGSLQTDRHEGYREVDELPRIVHVGCWSHTRRKFDEATKASKNAGSAHEALGRIAEICRIERDLRAQKLSPAVFLQERKKQVLPILEDFRQWLEANASQVPPRCFWAKRSPTR